MQLSVEPCSETWSGRNFAKDRQEGATRGFSNSSATTQRYYRHAAVSLPSRRRLRWDGKGHRSLTVGSTVTRFATPIFVPADTRLLLASSCGTSHECYSGLRFSVCNWRYIPHACVRAYYRSCHRFLDHVRGFKGSRNWRTASETSNTAGASGRTAWQRRAPG